MFYVTHDQVRAMTMGGGEPEVNPRLLINLRDDPVRVREGDTIHVRVDGRHLHVFDGTTGLTIHD